MKRFQILCIVLLVRFLLLGTESNLYVARLTGDNLDLFQIHLNTIKVYLEPTAQKINNPHGPVEDIIHSFNVLGVSDGSNQTVHEWQKDENGNLKESVLVYPDFINDEHRKSVLQTIGPHCTLRPVFEIMGPDCTFYATQLQPHLPSHISYLISYIMESERPEIQILKEEIEKIAARNYSKRKRIQLWAEKQAEQNYPTQIIEVFAIPDSATMMNIHRK